MEIIFPYREERFKLIGIINRPVALIELKSEFGWVPEWMYVDSGADISLLPRSLGDSMREKLCSGKINKKNELVLENLESIKDTLHRFIEQIEEELG